jgi:hypothetical protein
MKRDLKAEHTTCKENLGSESRLKKIIRSTPVVYGIILVLIYSIALVLFYRNLFFDFDMFFFFIGSCSWIVFYTNSQQIINKNQFKQFVWLGLFLIYLSVVLIIVTDISFFNLLITAFPLFYILYFRLLLFLFFKDFVTASSKPNILFASKGGKWTTESPIYGFVASKKEIVFSDLLFFGPFIFAGIVTYFITSL